MAQPTLLLVSPRFHGYYTTIAASLTKLGYSVQTHVYDAPGTSVERMRNKILHDLPERLRLASLEGAVTDIAIARLAEVKPDIVLVVKGDQLGDEWWQALQSSGARYGTWMYDELRRMRFSEDQLKALGPIASYSPADVLDLRARGFEAIDLPLAHDADLPVVPILEQSITFVGARYPGRENTLRALQVAGVPVKAYGKQWSRHLWDVVRTRQFAGPGIATGRDLGRPHAYGVMAASPATLNIHGDQDGFTMRTFEAPGVGGLHIVDRTDVDRYYDLGTEVLAYSSEDELVDICHRVLADPAWAQTIREAGRRRTLAEHTFDERVKLLETLWV